MIKLLTTLQESLQRATMDPQKRPHLLVKISPDLTAQDMKDVAEVS